jgi:DNA-directed RNA polymerase specialized sigma24 family protein
MESLVSFHQVGCSRKHSKFRKISKNQRIELLPWPRAASDDPNVQVGIDVNAKREDVKKLVYKYFKVDSISMDELLQEVYTAILYKNKTRSACDLRKSSFGHYVYMIADRVCINLINKKKRYDKESESIDEPTFHKNEIGNSNDSTKSMLESYEPEIETDDIREHIDNIESMLRERERFDLARYLRATKTGANPNTIREALSFGTYKVSNKTIKDMRVQIQSFIRSQDY